MTAQSLNRCLENGDHYIPPAALQATATDYNVVLQRTSAEQLLLNLVRLRYHEPTFFMQPSSVSAQLRRTVDLTAQAGINDASVTARNLGFNGHLGFSEQPTLTFVPMQGEVFMGQLLSRLDLQTLLLLYHSGWAIEHVFRLCVHSLNQTVNTPAASRVHGSDPEASDSFDAVLHLLRVLQRSGSIDIGYRQSSDPAEAVLSLSAADSDPVVQEFRKRLGLAPSRGSYRLVLGTRSEAIDPDAVVIATHSLMQILFFLSHAVDVPEIDLQRAVVTMPRDAAGNLLDWSDTTAGLFRVHVSDSPPPAESTRTFYRGHWFYVDDADLDSKSTLSLLSQLFSIQSGPAHAFAPVLTLPTGGTP